MQSITLNFVSIAALAAALPALQKLEGLAFASTAAVVGNAISPASTAHTAPTASAAVAGAQETKVGDSASSASEPKYTFKQVGDALAAYNKADAKAFGAAMQKFGFKSMKEVEAGKDKWDELMSYIGADQGDTGKTYTFDEVKAAAMALAKKDEKAFGAVMQGFGFKSIKDIEANPDKWSELMAKLA